MRNAAPRRVATMDVDDPNDAEALRRKLQKLDDERNRAEARISQQRRAERQPPPRRSQPTREHKPQRRREVYYRPGRGPNDSNDERASDQECSRKHSGTATARKKPTLSQGSASCRRMHPTPTRDDRKGCSAAWSATRVREKEF